MENLAERLARGEEVTPEEYEAATRERQIPTEIQMLKSVYDQKCIQCGSFVTVFECFLPETKVTVPLCLKCQDKVRSKQIPVTAVGSQDVVSK
jgi:hypothetical protein